MICTHLTANDAPLIDCGTSYAHRHAVGFDWDQFHPDTQTSVAAYRAAFASGEGGGVVLGREGIYQSQVFEWSRQIDDGTLGIRRRGPARTGKDPAKIRVRELEQQLQRARGRIETLEELVSAPGKILGAARRGTHRRQRDLDRDVVADVIRWIPRVGVGLACSAFGVAPRTWRYHLQRDRGEVATRPSLATGVARPAHPAKLSAVEEQAVLDMLCSDRFVDGGVWECWATLLDEGIYLCSESTMHRVLRDHALAGQRRQRRPVGRHPRPRLVATAPNMVWVWDISRLPGPGKGVWFYRYAVWDLWSRKNVGWCVDIVETVEIPEWLMTVTIKREHVDRDQLIIHSDRGAQMTAGTITDLYDMLGIRPSLSRPRMSNDNPHAEARVQNVEVPAGLARPVRDPRHRDLALRNFLRLVQPRPPSHRDRPPDTSGPSRRQRTTNQHRPPDRARQRPPTPPRTIPERATPTTPPEYGSTPPNYTPDNPKTQPTKAANSY